MLKASPSSNSDEPLAQRMFSNGHLPVKADIDELTDSRKPFVSDEVAVWPCNCSWEARGEA
jgi:hypothetical protein